MGMALALVAANEVSAAAERMRIMGFPIKASGELIGDAVCGDANMNRG